MRREYRVTVAYVKAGREFELAAHVMASSPGMAIADVMASGRRDVRSGVMTVTVREITSQALHQAREERQEEPEEEVAE